MATRDRPAVPCSGTKANGGPCTNKVKGGGTCGRCAGTPTAASAPSPATGGFASASDHDPLGDGRPRLPDRYRTGHAPDGAPWDPTDVDAVEDAADTVERLTAQLEEQSETLRRAQQSRVPLLRRWRSRSADRDVSRTRRALGAAIGHANLLATQADADSQIGTRRV